MSIVIKKSCGETPNTTFKWLLFILMTCPLAMEKSAIKNYIGEEYENDRQYGM